MQSPAHQAPTRHARHRRCTGADPNIPDFDGAAPLHSAVAAQDTELAAMLLAKGAECGGMWAMALACRPSERRRTPVRGGWLQTRRQGPVLVACATRAPSLRRKPG